MALDYTTQALDKLQRQLQVAGKDGHGGTRGIRVTVEKNGRGRYMVGSKRLSHADAVQYLAAQLEKEDKATTEPAAIQRTNFDWSKLNQATKDVFCRLCEEILQATGDASLQAGVRLGQDIPKIQLCDAPRVTNLKKAGLFQTRQGEKKSHRVLYTTEKGRQLAADLGIREPLA